MSMSKHVYDFDSYLSTHSGVEGFSLDYAVPSIPWHIIKTQNQRGDVCNNFPNFFQLDEADFNSP